MICTNPNPKLILSNFDSDKKRRGADGLTLQSGSHPEPLEDPAHPGGTRTMIPPESSPPSGGGRAPKTSRGPEPL